MHGRGSAVVSCRDLARQRLADVARADPVQRPRFAKASDKGHRRRVPIAHRDTAVQGHYNGFRLIDVSQPKKPSEIIDYEECAPKNATGAVPGNQGDISICGDILSRSWNSNTGPAGASCDGDLVPPGFEGLHIFDISDKQDPDLIASVDLPCGSHTQTMIPDVANGRLLVYVGSSSAACPNFDIVEIPIANPRPRGSFGRCGPPGTLAMTSDPANAEAIAYADPPAFPDGFEGGDWSTCWYNGRIYESDLVRGVLTWRINDPCVTAYYRTPFSNPQTQEFTIE